MRKNLVESKRVGRLVRAKPGQCYRNAWSVIQRVPEYADAHYVEGMAVSDGHFAFEHGWVEKDGVIIDPTPLCGDIAYFPGLRFRGQYEVAKAMDIPIPEYGTECLPLFYRFGWGGIESPEFRAALIAAYRHIGCDDLARRYEEYGDRSEEDVVSVTEGDQP